MVNILLALLSSSLNAFGTVLQKKGIVWIDKRRNQDGKAVKYLIIWLSGLFFAYLVSAVPMSIASKVLPPHIITAMSGWGIVVVVFLSALILKERIKKTDILFSLLIVSATIVIGLTSKPAENARENLVLMTILLLSPCIVFYPLLFKPMPKKTVASILAVFAGSMGGVGIVFFNILARQYFSYGFKSLSVSVLVLYLIGIFAGAASEQASYRLGEMTVVAPLRLSFFIIYPVICTFFLFKTQIGIIQIISILFIIFSCYGIFKGR